MEKKLFHRLSWLAHIDKIKPIRWLVWWHNPVTLITEVATWKVMILWVHLRWVIKVNFGTTKSKETFWIIWYLEGSFCAHFKKCFLPTWHVLEMFYCIAVQNIYTKQTFTQVQHFLLFIYWACWKIPMTLSPPSFCVHCLEPLSPPPANVCWSIKAPSSMS